MNKIRSIAALCAAMLLISSMSGCAKNDKSAASGTETSSASEPNETPAYTPKYSLSNPNDDVNAHKVYDVYSRAVETVPRV